MKFSIVSFLALAAVSAVAAPLADRSTSSLVARDDLTDSDEIVALHHNGEEHDDEIVARSFIEARWASVAAPEGEALVARAKKDKKKKTKAKAKKPANAARSEGLEKRAKKKKTAKKPAAKAKQAGKQGN